MDGVNPEWIGGWWQIALGRIVDAAMEGMVPEREEGGADAAASSSSTAEPLEDGAVDMDQQPEDGDGDDEQPPKDITVRLPEEVLVKVLEFLGYQEVLGGAGLCRLWAELARLRSVWRRREVRVLATDRDRDRGQAGQAGQARNRHAHVNSLAALRAAPCLRSVVVGPGALRYVLPVEEAWRVAPTLELHPAYDENELCLQALNKVAAAGVVRHLTLQMHPRGVDDLTPHLHALNDCQLETLAFSGSFFSCHFMLRVARQAEPGRASLRELTYRNPCIPSPLLWPNPVLQYLVGTHAPTLERLHVDNVSAAAGPALLADCARLRHVACTVRSDVPELVAAPGLESLQLNFTDITNGPDAAEFLSHATQLLRLKVRLLKDRLPVHVEEATLDMLARLAAPRCLPDAGPAGAGALLRELHIARQDLPMLPDYWDRLDDVVANLRHLRELTLEFGGRAAAAGALPPANFLRSVARRLAVLRLPTRLQCPGDADDASRCDVDKMCFLAEVGRQLAQNPRLHVVGLHGWCECTLDTDTGGRRMRRCLWWNRYAPEPLFDVVRGETFNVYNHADSEDCGLHHGPGRWLRLG